MPGKLKCVFKMNNQSLRVLFIIQTTYFFLCKKPVVLTTFEKFTRHFFQHGFYFFGGIGNREAAKIGAA